MIKEEIGCAFYPSSVGSLQAGTSRNLPVLAFGSGLTALGVLRCLAKSGVTVYSVCAKHELPTYSRLYRPAPLLDGDVPAPHRLAEFLDSLPFREAVLMPCSDDWVVAIAGLDSAHSKRFLSSVPCLAVAKTLTNKWRFAQFLEHIDVARPRSVLLTSYEDAAAVPAHEFEDMFLKPVSSQEFARHHNVKAFHVQNRDHALTILRQLIASRQPIFPVLLQEYISGPVTNYFLVDGFVDREGEIKGLFARSRQSQYPRWFGNSSRSRTIPLSHVRPAIESLERVLNALPYRGIFDAEFRYDDRDSQFKLLEINARPWWFVEFADRCGVDLCTMAYRDALGFPVTSVEEYDVGRECVYLAYDMAAHLSADGGIGGFTRWAKSCKKVEDIVFRWNDPKPALALALSSAGSFLKRTFRQSSLGKTIRVARFDSGRPDTRSAITVPGSSAPPVSQEPEPLTVRTPGT